MKIQMCDGENTVVMDWREHDMEQDRVYIRCATDDPAPVYTMIGRLVVVSADHYMMTMMLASIETTDEPDEYIIAGRIYEDETGETK